MPAVRPGARGGPPPTVGVGAGPSEYRAAAGDRMMTWGGREQCACPLLAQGVGRPWCAGEGVPSVGECPPVVSVGAGPSRCPRRRWRPYDVVGGECWFCRKCASALFWRGEWGVRAPWPLGWCAGAGVPSWVSVPWVVGVGAGPSRCLLCRRWRPHDVVGRDREHYACPLWRGEWGVRGPSGGAAVPSVGDCPRVTLRPPRRARR